MLYPPTLASTQPVFAISEVSSGYTVYFTLSSITSEIEIGHIGILVTQQSNNKSIANTTNYPDGVIYKSYTAGQTSVIIETSDLKSTWQSGSLYKIQLRFGSSKLTSVSNGLVYLSDGQISSFSVWHKNQVNANAFSEWSTAMIVKPIDGATLSVSGDSGAFQQAEDSSITLVSSLTPTFFGQCLFGNYDKEAETQYQFSIYENSTLLDTTGWLPHLGGQNSQDSGYFKILLENRHVYQITYEIKSNNGYYASYGPERFIAIQSTVGDITNLDIHVQANQKNGCVDVSLVSLDGSLVTGNYVITRTSDKSNYRIFEDIQYLNCINQDYSSEEVVFSDYTVESGVTYQYALQNFTTLDLRTNAKITKKIGLDLEYTYLYRDGIQLQLSFNQSISSFKHTTLRSKQDTLGSKYPYLFQNGNAYYAEFPISGLISFQDNTDAFFKPQFLGLYYKDELVVPVDKFETRGGTRTGGEAIDYTISTDLTIDNIYIERKFREKVEEFLNDFNCKLYRSATEGNLLINLMNVSLTPDESLGRMVYSFSATAYEIAEPTIDNLNLYGVLFVGDKESLNPSIPRLYHSFGQIVYWPGRESKTIYQKIAQQAEIPVGELYRYQLKYVDSIWVEPYPIAAIQATIDEEMARTGSASLYLQQAIQQLPTNTFQLRINGVTMLVRANQLFTFSANDNTVKHITNLQYASASTHYNYPIVVNYTCTLNIIWNSIVQETSKILLSSDLGQVRGLFCVDPDELSRYNADWARTSSLEIATIQNYSIYKSKDVKAVIKDHIKQQLELTGAILIEIEDGVWRDSTHQKEYRLTGINDIDIETTGVTWQWDGKNEDWIPEKSIELHIGESRTDYDTYFIGANERHLDLNHIYFADVLNNANIIEFANEDSIFAIINYNYFLEVRTFSSYG